MFTVIARRYLVDVAIFGRLPRAKALATTSGQIKIKKNEKKQREDEKDRSRQPQRESEKTV